MQQYPSMIRSPWLNFNHICSFLLSVLLCKANLIVTITRRWTTTTSKDNLLPWQLFGVPSSWWHYHSTTVSSIYTPPHPPWMTHTGRVLCHEAPLWSLSDSSRLFSLMTVLAKSVSSTKSEVMMLTPPTPGFWASTQVMMAGRFLEVEAGQGGPWVNTWVKITSQHAILALRLQWAFWCLQWKSNNAKNVIQVYLCLFVFHLQK